MASSAVARIRPAALRNNLDRARAAAPGSPVLAVVKADAYGHGLEQAVPGLDSADAFGVARFAEALRLRELLPDRRIVVMSEDMDGEGLAIARSHRLDVVVHAETQLEVLACAGPGSAVRVWLKLDSGMGRLGLAPERLAHGLECLAKSAAVEESPILMTHLANADVADDEATAEQLRRFGAAIGDWKGDVSIANSAGILAWPDTLVPGTGLSYRGRNWLRPGLMLYGVSPFASSAPADSGLEPAMIFEARLIDIRELPAGSRVGYGGDWTARRDSRIGVVNVGYADGYAWRIPGGTPVMVDGHHAPVVGRVSMDMISIDLTDLPAVRIGDPVTLWGDEPHVAELAAAAGTSPYELLTGVGNRVARVVAR